MRFYVITSLEIGEREAPSVLLKQSLADTRTELEEFASYGDGHALEHEGNEQTGCLALWQPGLPFGPQDPPEIEVTCLKCRIDGWDGEDQFYLYNPDRIGDGDMQVCAHPVDMELKL